jgi:hypothetical protein
LELEETLRVSFSEDRSVIISRCECDLVGSPGVRWGRDGIKNANDSTLLYEFGNADEMQCTHATTQFRTIYLPVY